MLKRSLIALLILLLLPSNVWGEDAICPTQDYTSETPPNFGCPGPGEETIVPDLDPPLSIPVHEGMALVAEWDGALVHRGRLVEVGLTIEGLRRLRWADQLLLRRQYDIQAHHIEEIAQAQQAFLEAQRDSYREWYEEAMKSVRNANAWWRSPALWFGVGMVVTGAVAALAVWGLSELDHN